MSLNLPPEFERAIRERVESGVYASMDDVFAACLKALEAREAAQQEEFAALGAEVQAELTRIAHGEVVDEDTVLNRMRVLYGDNPPPDDEFFRRMNAWRIAERVASGDYESAGDVIHSALCCLQELEAADATDDELREAIEEGLRSAETEPPIPGDEVVAHMRAIMRGERP